MRAVGLDYQRRQLTEVRLAEPRLEHPHEVLFRLHEVGICGTDRELAAFRLGFPPPGESFLVLGHEALDRLVLGAGHIGLLAALCLLHRGLRVRLHSLEPADHPRARLAESAGIVYVTRPERKADWIVEATGSADAAFAALRWLGPAGVCVLLGASTPRSRLRFWT